MPIVATSVVKTRNGTFVGQIGGLFQQRQGVHVGTEEHRGRCGCGCGGVGVGWCRCRAFDFGHHAKPTVDIGVRDFYVVGSEEIVYGRRCEAFGAGGVGVGMESMPEGTQCGQSALVHV